MAENYDITARLAEGAPAVDNIATYVWACHLLGYTNPDLTLHASQVRDWYGSEDGLDLRALDADCAALKSVVAATQDALARQDEQVAALSIAWEGGTADLSRGFLRRHGAASAAVAAAVRTSANALAALRDDLWHTVDEKVAAAIAADERASDDWLTAARTVATGTGDRVAASEQIDREVKPFVDNDIRDSWLAAMRSATVAVRGLYDVATAELASESVAVFDVPGELGPSIPVAVRGDEVSTVPAAAGVVAPPAPALPSWGVPASVPGLTAPAVPMPAPPVGPPAMPAPPSTPALGGMPEIGSGLSGFGQQLADAFGSLLSSVDDGLPDSPNVDKPELDDEFEDDEFEDDDTDDTDTDTDDDESVEPEDNPVSAEPVCAAAEAPVAAEPPPPEEPAPIQVPELLPEAVPPPAPAATPQPLAAETPCEIAADELPQAGQ